MPDFSSVSHIDLSVSDVERSATWYCEVLGLRRLRRVDYDGRIMVVLLREAIGLIIGLNQHNITTTDRFNERNLGLDHIGFGVADRDELDAWQTRLAGLAVEHSPVADTTTGAALVFRDPDNIQLEFWWSRPR
jgi:glyoxylase I family protein